MEENWERAVVTALNGESDCRSARNLTLDGAVKCYHGRLPPPDVLERFQRLEHLSIANVGVSSLEKFPHLPKLQKLVLSDNRISGGLEFLVQAGLGSLRDLDLSNNRIQYMEDLAPLAQLKLVSLDLYECPVTKIEDYRSRVFGLIRSLKYLDKMDADENERPESDEEEEEEDDDEDEEEEDDPGSGEIDGEGKSSKMSNGGSVDGDGVLDEDEESDADEEEREIEEIPNGFVPSLRQSNGFRVGPLRDEGVEDDVEEIDEQGGEEEDVVEVQEIDNSDEDDVEEVDEDGDDDDIEEVDEEEDVELVSTGRLTSTDGEIDGHDHGEDDGEEDENGELGEEEELNTDEDGNGDDDVENEDGDCGTEYLVQPIRQGEEDAGGSDFDPDDDVEEEDEVDDEEDEVDDEEEVENGELQSLPKRKRSEEDDGIEDDIPGAGSAAKLTRHHR